MIPKLMSHIEFPYNHYDHRTVRNFFLRNVGQPKIIAVKYDTYDTLEDLVEEEEAEVR